MKDSDRVSREFDPRFSRAFQPGYDPRVHREEPPAAASRQEAHASTYRDGARPVRNEAVAEAGALPTFAVDSDIDGTVDARSEPAGSGYSGPTNPTGKLDAEDDVTSDPRLWWRRVNPWFIVLWVLGLAFIGAGLGIVKLMSDFSQSRSMGSIDTYILSLTLQMAWIAAPMLVVLGLATLTSTAAIQAARWRGPRARNTGDPDPSS